MGVFLRLKILSPEGNRHNINFGGYFIEGIVKDLETRAVPFARDSRQGSESSVVYTRYRMKK